MPTCMADCPFCRVAAGRAEGRLVLADDTCVAFLDHRPLLPGHCLVVPRAHVETLGDLPRDLIGPLFAAVQLVAGAVERALQADGSFVAINNRVSQSVPHLHVHVVPRRRGDGLFARDFVWRRRPYAGDEEAEAARASIRAAIDELRRG